jgi:citrate synthase
VVLYDPSLPNTASCASAITYIDAGGQLLYRGYPVEDLARRSTFLDTAFLLLRGEFPDVTASEAWRRSIADAMHLPGSVQGVVDAFPAGASPMAVLQAAIAALAAGSVQRGGRKELEGRLQDGALLLGTTAGVVALLRRRERGEECPPPDRGVDFVANFASMAGLEDTAGGTRTVRALEVLFILHADLEQNCSATVARAIASTGADTFAAASGAVGALAGPLHGGACEQVVRMLEEIGTPEAVGAVIREVEEGKRILMGFGHRVFRTADPRAVVLREIAAGFPAIATLWDIAVELERQASASSYFIDKGIWPNIDLYSGMVERAAGFTPPFFPVLFAVGRMAGWAAQIGEQLDDPEQRILWPRQVYRGRPRREYLSTTPEE